MDLSEKIIAKYVEKVKAKKISIEDVPPLYIDAVRKALEE